MHSWGALEVLRLSSFIKHVHFFVKVVINKCFIFNWCYKYLVNYPSGEKLHKRCFPCIVETQKCLGYISLTKKSLYDEIVRYAKNIRSVKKMSSPGGLSWYKVQGSGATTEPSQEARNSKFQTYLVS